MELDRELLKGHIDLIILSLLSQKNRYGYEIAHIVKVKTQQQFELKEATMYLALKRLAKNQWIESYWGEETGGGRRKYYQILPLGLQWYKQKTRQWTEVKQIIDIFLRDS